MNYLLDQLFENIPSVTIVLSTLLPNLNSTADIRIKEIVNPKYRDIVKDRQERKQRIVLADMYPHVHQLGPDGTHPTDTGYWQMAWVWYGAVAEAASAGMLSR